MIDEQVLAERLISYDTSRPEELIAAAGFVKGWLESRDIEVRDFEHNGLPVLMDNTVRPRAFLTQFAAHTLEEHISKVNMITAIRMTISSSCAGVG